MISLGADDEPGWTRQSGCFVDGKENIYKHWAASKTDH